MDLQKSLEEYNTENKAMIYLTCGGEHDESHLVGDKIVILAMLVATINNIARSAEMSFDDMLEILKKTKITIDNANKREADDNDT